MIVCLCRGLSEAQVRAIIRAGADAVEDITRASGAGGDCTGCCEMLAELLEETCEVRGVRRCAAERPWDAKRRGQPGDRPDGSRLVAAGGPR